MLSYFFGSKTKTNNYRLLLLGWPGKTTFLYWNKLNANVTCIPTIGFNVESFKKCDIEYTVWDIGGCDKIKKLVTHYYEGTDAIIYFIGTTNEDLLKKNLDDFQEFVEKYELPKIPTVFFFVHRDLDQDKTTLSHKKILEISMPILSQFDDRPFVIQFGESSGSEGREALGQKEIFVWLETVLKGTWNIKKSSNKIIKKQIIESKDEKFEWMTKGDYVIYSSLSDDYSDEEILEKVENFKLDAWDHKTHLRLAYVIIKRDGRRLAVGKIMELIENYIKNSKNTNGKTFHLTMTYFWIHMVHLAIVLNNDLNFSKLLEKCAWLMNGLLFKYFYTEELMLKNENSRKVFTPPDKNPFPNFIPN